MVLGSDRSSTEHGESKLHREDEVGGEEEVRGVDSVGGVDEFVRHGGELAADIFSRCGGVGGIGAEERGQLLGGAAKRSSHGLVRSEERRLQGTVV
ncbi:UNVERIFIED_CONTAM: hypothetical protein Sangu_1134500 [Sesamum angustifolium]|uniref:Uncharacterized protein n=1 Tax=Sesamum angustifolium TaxID=2727405 RepID=A0AAW2NYW8_9LAMI